MRYVVNVDVWFDAADEEQAARRAEVIAAELRGFPEVERVTSDSPEQAD